MERKKFKLSRMKRIVWRISFFIKRLFRSGSPKSGEEWLWAGDITGHLKHPFTKAYKKFIKE